MGLDHGLAHELHAWAWPVQLVQVCRHGPPHKLGFWVGHMGFRVQEAICTQLQGHQSAYVAPCDATNVDGISTARNVKLVPLPVF